MATPENTKPVMRPYGAANMADALAVYVVGDSMSPRYEPGELLFVHPEADIAVGCDVVIELHPLEGAAVPTKILKRYCGRTATALRLTQFNPPLDCEVDLTMVKKISRVLTTREILGAT